MLGNREYSVDIRQDKEGMYFIRLSIGGSMFFDSPKMVNRGHAEIIVKNLIDLPPEEKLRILREGVTFE